MKIRGTVVKELRERSGLSQAELARRVCEHGAAKVRQAHIWQAEHAEQINIHYADELAQALSTTVDVLKGKAPVGEVNKALTSDSDDVRAAADVPPREGSQEMDEDDPIREIIDAVLKLDKARLRGLRAFLLGEAIAERPPSDSRRKS